MSTTTFDGKTVYVDVGSASDSFVGVVTVGLNATTGIPSGWYSDGSLIVNNGHYYPYRNDTHTYFDYSNNNLIQYDDEESTWSVLVYNASVFDKVPTDVITYLSTGDFTLVQG